MLNIFFANNSLTLELARLISKKSQIDNSILVIVNSKIRAESIKWDDELIAPNSLANQGRIKPFILDFKRSAAIYRKLISIVGKEPPNSTVNLYLPNLHHSLTNAAYYAMRKRFPNLNFTFNILVEGSLNFSGHAISIRYLPVMVIKKTLSFINGLPYRIFFGSFCGDDRSDFSKIYTPSLSGLKHTKISLEKIDFSENQAVPQIKSENSILVLGQYLESQLGKKNNSILTESFVNWIIPHANGKKIYYKGHPLNPDRLLESTLERHGASFIKPEIPLERIVISGDYKEIVSISSSGLMMAKLIMQEHVNCTAYGLDFLHKKTKINYLKIKNAYMQIGIHCVEIERVS